MWTQGTVTRPLKYRTVSKHCVSWDQSSDVGTTGTSWAIISCYRCADDSSRRGCLLHVQVLAQRVTIRPPHWQFFRRMLDQRQRQESLRLQRFWPNRHLLPRWQTRVLHRRNQSHPFSPFRSRMRNDTSSVSTSVSRTCSKQCSAAHFSSWNPSTHSGEAMFCAY
jgi:hypothetical protein